MSDVNQFEEQPEIDLDSIQPMGDLEDGSKEFRILDNHGEEQPLEPAYDFNENIAERLDDKVLNSLSSTLLSSIEDDKESRSEWETGINRALKYLGFKIEEFRDAPFIRACGAFDSTMSSALLKFWSVARAELFPMAGPATCEVLGYPTEEKLAQAERIDKFMNYYLRHIDKPYYADNDRMLMYTGFFGCSFKKIYQDPILNRPLSRFIEPQHFIVDNKTVSLMESPRITQEIFLSRKDLILRQTSGLYKKTKIPVISEDDGGKSKIDSAIDRLSGVNTDSSENKSLFKFYECHADLTPFEDIDEGMPQDDEQLPLPYIVTICATTKKIVAIRRNWSEGDQSFKRKNYFVQYQYLPSFGIYSLGIAHLAGSNAITSTSIQRQLIDAGTLKNFPGGLRAKGMMKLENNDKMVGPGEFLEVEVGAGSIADSIMLMPYAEPSTVLAQLRTELNAETQALLGVPETAISENRPDAPVGTTLALLENASRVQSSILRSLHVSLSEELALLATLFGEYLGDSPYPFSTGGQESAIINTDFNEFMQVIPVSDPTLTTSTQRIIRAEALLKIAQTAPEMHNMRAAYERIYKAMNVDDIDKILPPPPPPAAEAVPLDPITEVMNAMTGKPIVAAMWQDHPAHVMVKMQKSQELAQSNPQAAAALAANIAEHNAMQYLLDMQQQIGMQLPPLEQIQDPNVQNEIAMKAAEVAHRQMQEMQSQEQAQQPIDPNAVMMADIQQKDKATTLKNEIDRLKIEADIHTAQLSFESEKNKINIQKEIADNKNQITLAIAGMKQEEAAAKSRQILEEHEDDDSAKEI